MKEKLQTYDVKNVKSQVDEEVKAAFITSSKEAASIAVKYSASGKFDEKQVPLLNKKLDENVKRQPSLIAEVDDEDVDNCMSDALKKQDDSGNNNN